MTCVIDRAEISPIRDYDFKTVDFKQIYHDKYVYKCRACGLEQVDVSKICSEKLIDYYKFAYRNVAKIATADSDGQRNYYRARGRALADLIKTAPTRVFELGSGHGFNLMEIKNRYPDALLFTDELDETAGGTSLAVKGSLSDGPYDVIILSHVLEHFADPVTLLRASADALSPGGNIILEVPNDIPNIFPLNGPDEPHLIFFTIPTLKYCISSAGFTDISIFTAGPTVRYKNLKNRLKPVIRDLITSLPMFSNYMKRRSAKLNDLVDLSQHNLEGNVIRAVLSGKS